MNSKQLIFSLFILVHTAMFSTNPIIEATKIGVKSTMPLWKKCAIGAAVVSVPPTVLLAKISYDTNFDTTEIIRLIRKDCTRIESYILELVAKYKK